MKIEKFIVDEKVCTLYVDDVNSPLAVLNIYSGDGREIYELCKNITNKKISLLCVSNLNWNHDMTPWQPLDFMQTDECRSRLLDESMGGADEYLSILLEKILPTAYEKLGLEPKKLGVVGYSLGGLFALYSLYRQDKFSFAASVSGSLWFPGFSEFVTENDMIKKPEKLYISLGSKEHKTRDSLMSTVRCESEKIVRHYRSIGLDVTWELNPGNHFTEPEERTAKAISNLF